MLRPRRPLPAALASSRWTSSSVSSVRASRTVLPPVRYTSASPSKPFHCTVPQHTRHEVHVSLHRVWIVKNQLGGLNFSTVGDRTKLWCKSYVFTPCPEKKIPNIIDCHLREGHPLVIIFGTFILCTTGHQISVQYSTSPSVCFYTTWGKQNQRHMSWNKQKYVKKHPQP